MTWTDRDDYDQSLADEQVALDVWLRFENDDDEEAEAEANTYRDGDGYRVEWYLNSVGLVTEVHFDTYGHACMWLHEQGFTDFTS